jgi:hypothetical protein
MMPNTTIVTCKFGLKSKPSRTNNQFENGQTTY